MRATIRVRRADLRPLFGGLGIGLFAIGLADKLAFLISPFGVTLMLAGLFLLLLALFSPDPAPTWDAPVLNLLFSGLFLLFAALAALTPYRFNVLASGLTLAAGLAFLILEGRRTRWFRTWVVLGLLLAAHGLLILDVPFPKQDAFRILTYAVDHLFRHGLNPYLSFHDPVSPDVTRPYLAGYPPGSLFVLAPFRLVLGDVRWGFIAGEAAFVLAVRSWIRTRGGLSTWREAAVLLPLVLPRTSQAFYEYGNHDWVLLGLAAAALAVGIRQWAVAGLLLGIAVSTKQYFVLFPAAFLLPRLTRRVVLVALGTVAVLFLPFALWDGRAFFLSLIDTFRSPADPGRLTVTNLLAGEGIHLSTAAGGVVFAGGLAMAGWLAWVGRKRFDRALLAAGVGLMIVTLCSRFAAYNYYAYAIGLAAWGMALSGVDERDEPGRCPGVFGVPG